ncbi:2-keto-4-pentenoate hydratase [Streptomyces sp. TG1A-8]|uniref:2-keto-4-pentenoate hydratase n=1 Tax=Streptomyces sp. TG1A-8 TaxID=3051385 RepID=UPI00265BAA48|nr:2-keto-4-pentenoate hydratase [Streptomyces sp. TG1A-8]MDO0929948.1 2-keto-4-pentenoate hydratase [Streptomyces sp. TG1A-8]
MSTRTSPDAVHEVADTLARAAQTSTPCPPVRDCLGEGDIAAAYAVQQVNIQRRLAQGHRVVGRKIGLTSPSVQRQLGIEQPDYGALLSDMAVLDGDVIPAGRLLQPKIEAEVALVLGGDLPHAQSTVADVLRAVDFALPALEIVDSRIADWDIGIVDTVADNASSGLFVLGASPMPLTGVDLRSMRMTLVKGGEKVSQGRGSDCLGGPLNAAVWLASTLAEAGDPLRAGDIVLTGALGPMADASPGDSFEARISDLGSVRVSFGPHAFATLAEGDHK